jgi:hypothetical protein
MEAETAVDVVATAADELGCVNHGWMIHREAEDDMAKGQARSNKEKKKPKQDKDQKKGGTPSAYSAAYGRPSGKK